jgi:hypothetical protein
MAALFKGALIDAFALTGVFAMVLAATVCFTAVLGTA